LRGCGKYIMKKISIIGTVGIDIKYAELRKGHINNEDSNIRK